MHRLCVTLTLLACLAGCAERGALDLTGAAGFAEPSACILMAEAEHAFEDMLHAVDEGGTMRSDPFITLAGRQFSVRSSRRIEGTEGAHEYDATVRFPAGTRWHGLRLAAIAREERFFLGKDGLHTRVLTFEEPLGAVRAFATSMSIPVDKANEAPLEIIDNRSCEGTLRLTGSGARSEMRCEWGC